MKVPSILFHENVFSGNQRNKHSRKLHNLFKHIYVFPLCITVVMQCDQWLEVLPCHWYKRDVFNRGYSIIFATFCPIVLRSSAFLREHLLCLLHVSASFHEPAEGPLKLLLRKWQQYLCSPFCAKSTIFDKCQYFLQED